jgi:hypothetical protein
VFASARRGSGEPKDEAPRNDGNVDKRHVLVSSLFEKVLFSYGNFQTSKLTFTIYVQ